MLDQLNPNLFVTCDKYQLALATPRRFGACVSIERLPAADGQAGVRRLVVRFAARCLLHSGDVVALLVLVGVDRV